MRYFITIVLILSSLLPEAQQQQYFILLLKGDVQVKKPGRSYTKAKALQLLSLNDSIQLKNDQSEITIGNITGSRTEIKGKGRYKIAETHKKEASKGHGATSKFFAFLYEELLHPKKGFSQHSIAASWGGGSRGSGEESIWPLNGMVSSKNSIIFKWSHKSKILDYNFILYDDSETEVINCNVRDTQIVIHTMNLKGPDKTRYFWSIRAVGQPDRALSKYYFELVSKDQEEKMADSIIKEIPISDNEILYHLEIADQLGRNGLIDKALEYFEKAYKQIKNPQ